MGKYPRYLEQLSLVSFNFRMGNNSAKKQFVKYNWERKTPVYHKEVHQNARKKQSSKENFCELFSLATTLIYQHLVYIRSRNGCISYQVVGLWNFWSM